MNAEKPFDTTATADIVLRSSNNVHFYVLEAFLRYASPVFRDLLSLASADKNVMKNGLPIVRLTEDSKTLYYLLATLYPRSEQCSKGDSATLVKAVIAAEKYAMDKVANKLKKRLHKRNWLHYEPLRMYALALIVGWKEEATTAARGFASFDLGYFGYCEELEKINGIDFYRLLEFRFRYKRVGISDSQREELSLGEENGGPTACSAASDTKEPRDAAEPFNLANGADVIVRSSDSVDFYVSQHLLRLISPAFDDMFTKSATEGSKNGLKVVCVAGNSRELHCFFLMIYHRVDEPPINDLGLYADICLIARRYKVSAIEARLKKALMASKLLVGQPLRVYAIATALGWMDVAKTAALNTFLKPLEEAITNIPELKRISGGDLFRLVNYRLRCTKQCEQATADFKVVFPSGHAGKMLREALPSLTACPRGSTYGIALVAKLPVGSPVIKRNLNILGGNLGKISFPNYTALAPCFRDILRVQAELAVQVETAVLKVPFDEPKTFGWGWNNLRVTDSSHS